MTQITLKEFNSKRKIFKRLHRLINCPLISIEIENKDQYQLPLAYLNQILFMMRKIYLMPMMLIFSISTFSQTLTQTVRGVVVDADSKFPLMGASVIIGSKEVSTDNDGSFKINDVPIGRSSIIVSLFGYKGQTRSLELNSAKEAVLKIPLIEAPTQLSTVDVVAVQSGQAKNEMATVSSRQFSVEETNLYAGSRGEPARMATNFAGVQGSDDQRNDLVIRGNTPAGVLYRMDGINIPNPNHFSIPGTGGGPVTILNNKFLANSDFFTGAWPAEYGNAIAGVFDLEMRDGNNEKYEGSAQLGLLGTELMLEGPLGKKKGRQTPSFLGVYRYSTLTLFESLNIPLGTNAIPQYQDGAFRLTFPQRNGGKLALWTMFGQSNIDILISDEIDTSGFESYGDADRDSYFGSDMIVGGLSYSKPINSRSYLKAGLGASHSQVRAVNTKLGRNVIQQPDGSYGWNILSNDTMLNYTFTENKLHAYIAYNQKVGSRGTLQYGVNADIYFLNYQDSIRDYDGLADSLPPWRVQWATEAAWPVIQPYLTYKSRLTEKTTFTAGITSLYSGVNNISFMPVEPRLGISYQANNNDRFFAGTGLHAQAQAPYLYYYALTTIDHDPQEHNTDRIGLMKSLQFAGGWERNFSGSPVRTKVEAYYQYLYDIPVEVRPSSFSMLNTGSGFGRIWPDTLENTGTARNYGIEFTAERFFTKGFYFLTTASLFDAKYRGSDGIQRNTVFNGRYAINILGAKEFKLGENNRFTLGSKFTTVGGRWFGEEVDKTESVRTGEIVFIDATNNFQQYRAYIRLDLKIGYKWNYPKTAWEFGLDISNITNHKNILTLTYVDGLTNPVREEYQLGLFPVFYLRCDF